MLTVSDLSGGGGGGGGVDSDSRAYGLLALTADCLSVGVAAVGTDKFELLDDEEQRPLAAPLAGEKTRDAATSLQFFNRAVVSSRTHSSIVGVFSGAGGRGAGCAALPFLDLALPCVTALCHCRPLTFHRRPLGRHRPISPASGGRRFPRRPALLGGPRPAGDGRRRRDPGGGLAAAGKPHCVTAVCWVALCGLRC